MADIIPSPAVTGEEETDQKTGSDQKTFFNEGVQQAPPPVSSDSYPSKVNHVIQSFGEEDGVEPNATSKPLAASVDETDHTDDDKSNWIDVLGNGSLLKKILKPGDGVSSRPSPLSEVTMRVLGSLPNGTVIDKHNSLRFIVSDGDVVQAVDIVASLMQRGEICCVKADPKYAYGSQGRSPNVPPESPVMYELELLEVLPPLDLESISESSLIQYLNKKRGRGNDLFQRKEYSQAVVSYGRAVKTIRDFRRLRRDESSDEINDLWIRCLNNLAAAQLKVEQYHEALDSAREVLKCDPDNVKALYRCGKVLLIIDEIDESVQLLQRACELSPDEKAISSELQKALRKQNQNKKSEKELYQRMINPNVNKSPKQSQPRSSKTSDSNSNNTSSSWGWKGIIIGAGIAALVAVGAAAIYNKYRK